MGDVFSFGGGKQSTAALVLAAQGQISVDAFLFANVGDDSENPATLRYVAEVSKPYADAHGLNLIELRRRRRNGDPFPSLYQKLMTPGSRSIPIPVRLAPSGAFGRRQCTERWKMQVVNRYVTDQGATEDAPWTVAIGFSTDELLRVNTKAPYKNERRTFPLIDLGLSRRDCERVVADAGLPPAPKSSCFFCPFQTPSQWAQRRQEPEWPRVVALEDTLNARAQSLGRGTVTLGPVSVHEVADQPTLLTEDDGECDTGWCFT